MYEKKLAIEALVVGLVLALLWLFLRPFLPVGDVAAAFAVGIVAHLGFELTGANAWYCKNGAAC